MTSAQSSGASPTTRARARGVLVRACDDGLLDKTLEKWVGDPREQQVADAVPAPRPDTGDTDTAVGSVALNSEGPTNASESAAPTQRRKKKDRGRSLAAALALGDQQANPDFEPTPEQRQCTVAASVGASVAASVAADTVPSALASTSKLRRATVDAHPEKDHREVHARQLIEAEEEIKRRAKAKQLKKFAHGVRQAAKKQAKIDLHTMRVEYIENKLKDLVEHLVAKVSAKDARPQNPVPVMIEVLSEIAGKSVNAFKNISTAGRIRREIEELKEQIEYYQEMYDNGDRFTQGSDEEAELPSELDEEDMLLNKLCKKPEKGKPKSREVDKLRTESR